MDLFVISTATFIYFCYKIKNIEYKNNQPCKIRYTPPDKLYFYCDEINNMFVKNKIENIVKNKIDKINWEKKNIKIHQDLYKFHWKNKFNKVLDEFKNNLNNNYCLWVYNNDIRIFKDHKIIVLDFRTIYNYDTNTLIDKQYIENLSKFSHQYKIIFVLVSELRPEKILGYNFVYLNKNNITTPYNYRVKSFGGINRLKDNELADKPAEISINKIILDIFNRYGGNYQDTLFIGRSSIPRLTCKILKIYEDN